MNKLEALYSAIENFQKLGVKIDEKTIESTLSVEESIIRAEMIPAMSNAIIPIISQIQRELVLVIEYSPDKPIELKMTRKRSFKLTEEEESIITQRKEFKKEVKYTLKSHTKSPKTNLLVSFPTGVKIKNKLAMNTFCEVIEKIGLQKVEKLNIRSCGSNLVSKIKEDFSKQKIMYSEIVREPQFYLDEKGEFYPEATTFIMTGGELEYLYHLLHSKPVTYFFKTFYAGGGLGSEGYRYKKAFIEKLPIPKNNKNLDINSENTDNITYNLYDLNDKEIEFIENQYS